MTQTAALVLLLVPGGAAAGSFLAAWAERLAHGESIVAPRSRCRDCRAAIAWHDKLPVISWLWLRGRCRACGGAIPAWLPGAEIAGMVLAVLAVGMAQSPVQMVLAAVWLWLLMGLALCDLAAFRLPDALNVLLLLAGLGLATQDPRLDLSGGIAGAVIGAGAFWMIRIGYARLRGREGLGLGDVKLMAGIGAGLGWAALPAVALLAALGALALTLLDARRRGATARAQTEIPFGAYLCGAAALVWLAG